MGKRYRIWHDGTGMKHPFQAYFAGLCDSVKEARSAFSMHRISYSKGVMQIHEVDSSGAMIRVTSIKPLPPQPNK